MAVHRDHAGGPICGGEGMTRAELERAWDAAYTRLVAQPTPENRAAELDAWDAYHRAVTGVSDRTPAVLE